MSYNNVFFEIEGLPLLSVMSIEEERRFRNKGVNLETCSLFPVLVILCVLPRMNCLGLHT